MSLGHVKDECPPVNEKPFVESEDMVSYKENLIKLDIKPTTPEYNFNKSKDAASKKINGSKEELNQMKELLLAHLDYIQQQTDYLCTKDKTIHDLKHENEMLKQKIHRMGRRVSLTKTRSSAENGDKNKASTSAHRSPRKGTSPASPLGLRKRTRQDSIDNQEHKKRSKDVEEKKKNKDIKKERKKSPEMVSGSSSLGLSPPLKARGEASIGPLLSRFEKLTLTSSAYYTAVGEETEFMPSPYPPIPPAPKATLEVPKWTIKTYTSSYTLEGTENLSDDVFDRRHFRLAIDEKRRKRWDVQRIREQRQIEKLRQREEKRKEKLEAINNPTPIHSFWPDPDEITDRLSLVVMEKIPVAVFGISIPYTPESEPTLWWQNGKVPTSNKTKRRGKR